MKTHIWVSAGSAQPPGHTRFRTDTQVCVRHGVQGQACRPARHLLLWRRPVVSAHAQLRGMSACTPRSSPTKTSCTHARRQRAHTAASTPSATNLQAGETQPVLVERKPQAAVATLAAAGLQQLLHVVHAEPVAAAAAVLGK